MAAYHPLDTLLAWLEGIFVGMADVSTTLDWENCKLPVVVETMKRIGQCACGDKAYSIPEETKSRVETQFWYAHSVHSLHDFCFFVFFSHTLCAGMDAATDTFKQHDNTDASESKNMQPTTAARIVQLRNSQCKSW